jgi:hypothetical protein
MNPTLTIKPERTVRRSVLKFSLSVTLALAALTAAATLPFFVIGEDQKVGCCGGAMPVTHDSWMHFNQMRSFYRGLVSGRIYPRWDDETHHGCGAPTTSFYPPGAYYITSVFYFLTRDWRWVWVSFYWLASFGSAVAIYWYARQTMSRAAGLMAAAVYVFAPYHLINQYQRGAMAEFLSFVWAPLLLLFAERLLGDSSWRRTLLNAAGLAASFGAFLWSHPPTAYQFLLVFGSCFAIWAIRRGEWRKLAVIGGALLFGSMLAAAYFFPAILEQRLINADDVERTWPYHASYVYDSAWQVYDRAVNPFFVRIDRIWIFTTVAILITAATLFILRRGSGRAWLWTSAGLLSCFLMTKYSAPVGRLIPKIEIGVFSWRMLALASLSLALLAGEVCSIAFRRKRLNDQNLPPEGGTTNSLPLASSLLVLLGALAMSAWYAAWPMWRGQSFEPNPEHYNYATLPRGAPREVPQMESAKLASGNGRVTIKRWAPERRELTVELEEPDQLRLRMTNFPGWTALVDGQEIKIKEGAVKNIVVDLPAGEHQVTLDFRSTPIRRASNFITVLSFASLISIICWSAAARGSGPAELQRRGEDNESHS